MGLSGKVLQVQEMLQPYAREKATVAAMPLHEQQPTREPQGKDGQLVLTLQEIMVSKASGADMRGLHSSSRRSCGQ